MLKNNRKGRLSACLFTLNLINYIKDILRKNRSVSTPKGPLVQRGLSCFCMTGGLYYCHFSSRQIGNSLDNPSVTIATLGRAISLCWGEALRVENDQSFQGMFCGIYVNPPSLLECICRVDISFYRKTPFRPCRNKMAGFTKVYLSNAGICRGKSA